jgi:hypothetical protein
VDSGRFQETIDGYVQVGSEEPDLVSSVSQAPKTRDRLGWMLKPERDPGILWEHGRRSMMMLKVRRKQSERHSYVVVWPGLFRPSSYCLRV